MHLPTFNRFEGWAERVVRSDVALGGEQALREATFAPLRSNRDVLWAQVRDEAGQALEFQAPIALDALAFMKLEGAERGSLRVAISKDCRPASQPNVAGRPCVVIATAPAPQGRSLCMAFRVQPLSLSASGRTRAVIR